MRERRVGQSVGWDSVASGSLRVTSFHHAIQMLHPVGIRGPGHLREGAQHVRVTTGRARVFPSSASGWETEVGVGERSRGAAPGHTPILLKVPLETMRWS